METHVLKPEWAVPTNPENINPRLILLLSLRFQFNRLQLLFEALAKLGGAFVSGRLRRRPRFARRRPRFARLGLVLRAAEFRGQPFRKTSATIVCVPGRPAAEARQTNQAGKRGKAKMGIGTVGHLISKQAGQAMRPFGQARQARQARQTGR